MRAELENASARLRLLLNFIVVRKSRLTNESDAVVCCLFLCYSKYDIINSGAKGINRVHEAQIPRAWLLA